MPEGKRAFLEEWTAGALASTLYTGDGANDLDALAAVGHAPLLHRTARRPAWPHPSDPLRRPSTPLPDYTMNIRLDESWRTALAPEFDKLYFSILTDRIRQAYQHEGPIYPPGGSSSVPSMPALSPRCVSSS